MHPKYAPLKLLHYKTLSGIASNVVKLSPTRSTPTFSWKLCDS